MRTPLTGRPCATILMYHSISEPSSDRIHRSIVVSPATFEFQMAYLASRAKVIPLEEYVVARREGTSLEHSSVIITFDDGYKDNFTNAFPVLAKYGLPATFFVSTEYIGTGRVKWEDRLNAMVRRSPAAAVSVKVEPTGEPVQFDLTGEAQRGKAVNRMIRTLGGLPSSARRQALEQLDQQLEEAVDFPKGEDLMLSWDEIREMAVVPGISFGAHGASHCRLSQLSSEAIDGEIGGSKREIEREIQAPVSHFSYPYGEPSDFDQSSVEALKAHGFHCAITTVYGTNDTRTDPFRLKRIGVPNQVGQGFAAGLWLRSSIAGQALRRAYDLICS